MAALLVGLGIMSVMLTVAMPVWSQMARREREAELVFRGEQYKRALELFQRRNGPGVTPPSVEALVEGRFLRREFKDPITGDDFRLLRQGMASETPAGNSQSGQGGTPGQNGRGSTPVPTGRGGLGPSGSSSPGFASGGIVGVASTSTQESLLIYNGRTRYNEWDFTFVQQTQAAGGSPGEAGGPGGPGGPPGVPGVGGRGQGRGRGFPPGGLAPGGRGGLVPPPTRGGREGAPPNLPPPAPSGRPGG